MNYSATTLCYIERNGCYLMMHRTKKENDENRDKWIGIGGHLEFGEDPFDGILRETREETGLLLESPSYRGMVTFCLGDELTESMHLFHADRFSGQCLKDCPEGELEWIPKETVRSLPHWEGDDLFLDLLDRNVPFFSLKLVYDREGTLLSHTLHFCGEKRDPLLISACLCGQRCRYDAGIRPLPEEILDGLAKRYVLIPVCPEQAGGLPTPRIPSEIQPDGSVRQCDGTDVTETFLRGAEETAALARFCGAERALLKERSPSCGIRERFDGSFSGKTIPGMGKTAERLLQEGVRLFSEEETDRL